MSKWLPTETKELEFEGDAVRVSYSRLEYGDFLRLAPHLKIDGAGNVSSGDLVGNVELCMIAAELLPKYVRSFTGLTDATGAPVTLEAVCKEIYFLPLVADLLACIVTTGGIKDKEMGNSNATHAPVSRARMADSVAAASRA